MHSTGTLHGMYHEIALQEKIVRFGRQNNSEPNEFTTSSWNVWAFSLICWRQTFVQPIWRHFRERGGVGSMQMDKWVYTYRCPVPLCWRDFGGTVGPFIPELSAVVSATYIYLYVYIRVYMCYCMFRQLCFRALKMLDF